MNARTNTGSSEQGSVSGSQGQVGTELCEPNRLQRIQNVVLGQYF